MKKNLAKEVLVDICTGDDQLLEKTCRHKNINCSTQVEQLTKKMKTGQKSSAVRVFQAVSLLDKKNINCSNCNWSTKVL
jgi:iron-sulfur cluster repair protein YtfE (RIC family)